MDHDNGTIGTALYQVTKSFPDQSHELIEDNNGNTLLHIQLKEDYFATLITITVKVAM